MITDFGNLSIRNINHAWLEAKLTEKHMNFLWECVSKRKKETYKNLAGNLYGSYSLENKDYEKIFYDKIINFYTSNSESLVKLQEAYGVGTDQPILNFFVQQENIDCKYLPYEWNMQDMSRTEILNDRFTFAKIGWIYHFNGIPNNQNSDLSYHWMKKTYEHLYG